MYLYIFLNDLTVYSYYCVQNPFIHKPLINNKLNCRNLITIYKKSF